MTDNLSQLLDQIYKQNQQSQSGKPEKIDRPRREALAALSEATEQKIFPRVVLRDIVAQPQIIGFAIPSSLENPLILPLYERLRATPTEVEALAQRALEHLNQGSRLVLKPLKGALGMGFCLVELEDDGIKVTATSPGIHRETGEKILQPWHQVLESSNLRTDETSIRELTTYHIPTNAFTTLFSSYLNPKSEGCILERFIDNRILNSQGNPLEPRFEIFAHLDGRTLSTRRTLKVGGNPLTGTVTQMQGAHSLQQEAARAYLEQEIAGYADEQVEKLVAKITDTYIQLFSSVSFIHPTDLLQLTIDLCLVRENGEIVPMLIETHNYVTNPPT